MFCRCIHNSCKSCFACWKNEAKANYSIHLKEVQYIKEHFQRIKAYEIQGNSDDLITPEIEDMISLKKLQERLYKQVKSFLKHFALVNPKKVSKCSSAFLQHGNHVSMIYKTIYLPVI